MILEMITEYIAPIVMIIGLIEFTRKAIEKKLFSLYMILQAVFCLIAGLLIVLEGWIDGFTAGLVVAIAYKWLMLISLSTLFYNLVVKKIRDAGGKVEFGKMTRLKFESIEDESGFLPENQKE